VKNVIKQTYQVIGLSGSVQKNVKKTASKEHETIHGFYHSVFGS
jgi:hypothetical protein